MPATDGMAPIALLAVWHTSLVFIFSDYWQVLVKREYICAFRRALEVFGLGVQLLATRDGICSIYLGNWWDLRFAFCRNICKGKVHPRTGQEGPDGEQMYSSTLSLTSALDWVGGQRHGPAALPPGKTRYPLYRRLGGPQGRTGRIRKNLIPAGIRSTDRPARSESLYRLSYPGRTRICV